MAYLFNKTLLLTTAAVLGWLIIALGVFEVVKNMEENECEMTYMFEYPEYLQIDLDPALKKKFPKYSLVIYGEGHYAMDLTNNGMSGIPVLFIPGNAGSYKQVRSLGSVALKKTETLPFHFDFFAVDFKEELSALKGSYLVSQTAFVNECLKLILEIYKKANKERHSVILVGHSMGGVIARGLFTIHDFNPINVNTIITLATPHKHPAINVDQDMHNYYFQLDNFWGQSDCNNSVFKTLKHILIVSVGGGSRDMQVCSDLTPLSSSVFENQSLSVITTAIPKVYLSTDHRCIVWCKQLVLSITRALIDMVDKKEFQVAKNESSRLEVLKYHLISAFSSENSAEVAVSLTKGQPEFSMNLSICKVFYNPHFFKSTAKSRSCFILVLNNLKGKLSAFYEGKIANWIGVCESIHQCNSFTTLSRMAHIIPRKSSNANILSMNVSDILKYGSILVLGLDDPKKERVSFRIGNNLNNFRVPYLLSREKEELHNQRTTSRVIFPSLRTPWLVYKLKINASCRKAEPSVSFRFHVPWMNEDIYKVFTTSIEIKLKFTSPSSPGSQSTSLSKLFLSFFKKRSNNIVQEEGIPEIQLWFHDRCNFTLEMWLDPIGTAGQLLFFIYPSILYWLPALTLLWLLGETNKTNEAHFIFTLCHAIPALLAFAFFSHYFVDLLLVLVKLLISNALLMAIVYFSKLFLLLLLLVAKLVHIFVQKVSKQILNNRYQNFCEKIVSAVVLTIESIFPVMMSLLVSGSIGVLAYLVCFLMGVLWRSSGDTRCLCCSIVMTMLNAPSLVSLFKEVEYGMRFDFNITNVSSAVLVLALHVINVCKERQFNNRKTGLPLVYLFAFFIILKSDKPFMAPQIFSFAVFVYCIATKCRVLRSFISPAVT